MRTARNFVFVNLSINSGFYGLNHGIAYLVPVVKKNGFRPSLINLMHEMDVDEFRERIEALAPRVVGFSGMSPQLPFLNRYSKAIGDLPALKIAGGVGPTLSPEDFLAHSGLDGVLAGEGEIALDRLLSAIGSDRDLSGIDGFCWNRNGKVLKNKPAMFVSDLSRLALPDYDIFGAEHVVYENGAIAVMISRGCPYNCSYCCNHAIKKVYPSTKGYFRLMEETRAILLIKNLLRKYPNAERIEFEDDLLIANKRWFENFSDLYRKQIGIPYRMNARPECVTSGIAERLFESGCDIAYLGLESGNEHFRRQSLNRRHGNEVIETAGKRLKEAGIQLFTFNMVGLPGETPEQMLDTLALNKKMKPDSGICTFFYPFAHTKLYDLCEKNDLLPENDVSSIVQNYNLRPSLKLHPGSFRAAVKVKNELTEFFFKRKLIRKYAAIQSIPVKFLYTYYFLLRYYLWSRILKRSIPASLKDRIARLAESFEKKFLAFAHKARK